MERYSETSKSYYHQILQSIKAVKGLPNYGVVTRGFSRSAQPNRAGLEHLKKAGISVIVKLNRNEEFSVAHERQYFGGTVIDKPLNLKDVTKEDGLSIADTIQQELKKGQRVLVHCQYGRDRTGLVVGAWRLKYGRATLADLRKDWKAYGRPGGNVVKILKEINAELNPEPVDPKKS